MSNNLGIGAMLGMLCGHDNEAEHARLKEMLNGKITRLEMADDVITLNAGDGIEDPITIFDGGQSCCESRYMRTDDNLQDFIGATLVNVELVNAPNIQEEGDYGEPHEIQILKIMTDKGTATFTNHNIHNGYYGGFAIQLGRAQTASERYRGV